MIADFGVDVFVIEYQVPTEYSQDKELSKSYRTTTSAVFY